MILAYLRRVRLLFAQRGERGQSLTEMALFAPVFVIMLAGLVEIGQYTIIQNRLSTASRSAARFAANGGEDEGMATVALNSVKETNGMPTDPDRWDMWSIRARVNEDGTDFDLWDVQPIYGLGQTERFTITHEAIYISQTLKTDVLDDLQAEGDVANLRIVGSLILFDAQSIIGINNLWAAPYSLRSLNVLRVTGLNLEQTNGCAAFPIAIPHGVQSVANLPPGGYIYPVGRVPSSGDFPLHEPGKSLDESREGFVYVFNDAQLSWLAWNPLRTLDTHVAQSLVWPGNSLDYATEAFPNQRGYVEPGDPDDQSLHVGDQVALGSGASINNPHVQTQLQAFVEKGRTMRLIVWDEAGGNIIGSFAVFRLHGFGSGWIMAEFIGMDNSCGQVIAES